MEDLLDDLNGQLSDLGCVAGVSLVPQGVLVGVHAGVQDLDINGCGDY